ncbi:transcriptional regulator [Burkholderia vietnamiensis]|uniref:helix-turn-helix domain-containing protein n=1 Tax=Burkholderia cepacia complex TaxID=87882 RepID=UPI00075D268A|nr:helix-turn-helix transcriptional regulator [Burkholderia vietnamiensis]KVF96561.1 transcriptional regulator [Burkholderia vietnamiensis]
MNANEDADEQRQQMARRLREARAYLGLSQDDVANALGISRPAVTNIESGVRKVEAVELDKLARLYGRPVQFFLTGEEPAGSDPKVEFLARTLNGLSERDIEEVSRFAEFLKRSPKSGGRGDK